MYINRVEHIVFFFCWSLKWIQVSVWKIVFFSKLKGVLFGRYLWVTNTATGGLFAAVGDVLQQTAQQARAGANKKIKHDWHRTGIQIFFFLILIIITSAIIIVQHRSHNRNRLLVFGHKLSRLVEFKLTITWLNLCFCFILQTRIRYVFLSYRISSISIHQCTNGILLFETILKYYISIHGRDYGWCSTGRMLVVGLSLGLPQHCWYTWLDRILPGVSMLKVTKKIFLDQLILAPVVLCSFFMVSGLLERHSLQQSWKEVQNKFAMVYKVEYSISSNFPLFDFPIQP